MYKIISLVLVLLTTTLSTLLSTILAKEYIVGVQGNSYEISEVDLLQLIKERANFVNWQALADNYTKKLQNELGNVNTNLGIATVNNTRYVEVWYTLPQEIFYYVGNKKVVQYPAGYRFNVLSKMRLSNTYIFINATRPAEINFVKSLLANNSIEVNVDANGTEVNYEDNTIYKILTSNYMIMVSSGNVFKVMEKLRHRAYVLDSTLAGRFQVERTPSIVTQLGDKLKISEYAVSDDK